MAELHLSQDYVHGAASYDYGSQHRPLFSRAEDRLGKTCVDGRFSLHLARLNPLPDLLLRGPM
ncbi:hypothetical protein VCV18_005701 [Metarhizium anisopliae]